jgi:signal transduction histidine kinase
MDAEKAQSVEFLSALQALSEGLAIFDSNDTMVFCNARLRGQLRGLEHMLQAGLPWEVFCKEMTARGLGRGLDILDRHLQSGSGEHRSVEAHWPGDQWMRLGLSLTNSGGFVLTLSDISEAVQAAELRAEADDLLRHVLDACGVNLLMARIADGEIIYRNPACVSLFGDRGSEKENYRDPVQRADFLAELLAAGSIDGFDVDLKRADGTVFPGKVTARLIEYAGESVIVSSTSDMTQLYAQRDELARQREASFQNEKLTALGELLAGVAHELNNPLSVVVGQSLMLREETAETDLSQRVDKISTSAERCAKIVKTFLAMARQKPARLAPVSFNEIIETAVDVAAFGIRSAGGEIQMDLASDLTPVLADEDQITQVIVNLLVNAQQATKEKGDDALIRIRSWDEADHICTEVTDNGPGIPPNLRSRVFEPFFSTKSDGAGVGLALCHRIVAGHNGTLTAGQADGGGALFLCRLPKAKAMVATDTPNEPFGLTALKALIVEDEDDVADILSDMLTTLGVAVQTAPSAEDAIDILERGARPDIILSDVVMPGIGGQGLLRTLRQRWPDLCRRLAFVTGDSMGDDIRDLDHPVLEKPVAPHELRGLLRDMIHQGAKG